MKKKSGITVTLLAGRDVVKAFDNGDTLGKIRKAIRDNPADGYIYTRKFNTQKELAAYKRGIYDTLGWTDVKIIGGKEI